MTLKLPLAHRPRLRAAIVAALVIVLLALWLRDGGNGISYRTVEVGRGPIALLISATGNLKALSTVEVGSQVSGQVLSVNVDFNDAVKKGEIIATIDPANFQARLTQAQADLTSSLANLSAAHANLGEAQATLRNLEAEYARKQQVFERKLISRSEYDAALSARDQALARLASARAGIKVAQSQVAQRRAAVQNAELDVQYTVIRAPVDGVVLSRTVEPGQTVAASFQTPVLFSIAEDLSQMQIDLNIDEADVGQVREGLPVRFTVDAFAGREYQGTVRQVRLAATNTANVITYPVVVNVTNADGSLLPGMTANAEVLVANREDVLRLANGALRYRPSDVPAPTAGGTGQGGDAGNGAAGGGRPAGNPMAQWDELAERLQLSEAQRGQLRSALMASFQAMRGQAGGAVVSEDQRRRRTAEAIATALQPLRAQLAGERQKMLDAELALQANARRVTVYVLRDGKPEPVSVRVGLSDTSFTEVLAGVKEGEQVIIGEQQPAP
ncbi:MAG: efflux RND transporter periplasmic adaptor subunit [Xanthomonadales bacterium]|nr:efflux RND transporter periplasmic adaptor subunit [Xanthomonadales bacterium]MDZ4114590.1 efflux RND transporter periplasmic adaptor subunit [Xanthomonadaceae bacterium]MDZ4379375.1 efflux RND transporter periplasmic adaptor subunit [Xanthomonadaceae bacterium]